VTPFFIFTPSRLLFGFTPVHPLLTNEQCFAETALVNRKFRGVAMKISKILACIVCSVLLQCSGWSSDCPGFCVQCRSDAIFVCGSGCVQSFSCSLSTCTCSFSSRTSGRCPHAPTASILLRERLDLPNFELASWRNPGTQSSASNIKLDVVPQPEVPLAITNLAISNDWGRQVSTLTYTIKNEARSHLQAVSVIVVLLNDRNEPLGGEVLREDLGLNSGEERRLQSSLTHYVDSGQVVRIAFTSYRTDAETWAAEHEQLIESMKQR
jgi:hypothetical protein